MPDQSPHDKTLASAREWIRLQCPVATDDQIREGARRMANLVLWVKLSEPTLTHTLGKLYLKPASVAETDKDE